MLLSCLVMKDENKSFKACELLPQHLINSTNNVDEITGGFRTK